MVRPLTCDVYYDDIENTGHIIDFHLAKGEWISLYMLLGTLQPAWYSC